MKDSALLTELQSPALRHFCEKHHIRVLRLFGSAARGEDGPESDLDILAEFEQGHTPGFAFFGLAEELEQILHKKIDLHTPGTLSLYFRNTVLSEAITLYQKR